LKSSEESLSDKSLPEGDLVSSCLSHFQGATSRSFSDDPLAGETVPSIGSVLSVYSIGGFKPSSYAVHDARLSHDPAKLEENFDIILPKSGRDQVLLVGKDRDKTERLLRLGSCCAHPLLCRLVFFGSGPKFQTASFGRENCPYGQTGWGIRSITS